MQYVSTPVFLAVTDWLYYACKGFLKIVQFQTPIAYALGKVTPVCPWYLPARSP